MFFLHRLIHNFKLVFEKMVFHEKRSFSYLVGFACFFFFSLIWKREETKNTFAAVSKKFCAFHSVDLFHSNKPCYLETQFDELCLIFKSIKKALKMSSKILPYVLYPTFEVKVGLSIPNKMFYLLQWKPFKNDHKCFLFHLKSSFRSQDT